MADDPQPLRPDEVKTLDAIYRLFNRAGDWPSFEELDYDLDREGSGDAWAVLRALPSGYVSGSDFHSPPSNQQQFSLTIKGMGAVSKSLGEAAEDFRVFCGTVVWACRMSDETRPPETALIQGTELPDLIDLPATGRSALIARVGKLWAVNGHLWTQMSGVGDSWSAVLNRKGLRAYRGVSNEEEFLAADRRRLVVALEERAAFISPSPSAGALVGSAAAIPQAAQPPVEGDRQWFGLLPEPLAVNVRARIQIGHAEDALVEAWKTLATALVALSGRNLDGYDLVNQTFKTFDLSGMTPAQKNEHEGHVDLMRGLARIRNVHSHPGARPLTDIETAGFILTAGACLEWVQSLEPPAIP